MSNKPLRPKYDLTRYCESRMVEEVLRTFERPIKEGDVPPTPALFQKIKIQNLLCNPEERDDSGGCIADETSDFRIKTAAATIYTKMANHITRRQAIPEWPDFQILIAKDFEVDVASTCDIAAIDAFVLPKLRALRNMCDCARSLDESTANAACAVLVMLQTYLRACLHHMSVQQALAESYALGIRFHMRRHRRTIMGFPFDHRRLFPECKGISEGDCEERRVHMRYLHLSNDTSQVVAYAADSLTSIDQLASMKWEFLPAFQTRESFLALACVLRRRNCPIELRDTITEYYFLPQSPGVHNTVLAHGRCVSALLGDFCRRAGIHSVRGMVVMQYYENRPSFRPNL